MTNRIEYGERESLHHVHIANIFYYVLLLFTVAYFAILPLRNTSLRHIIVIGGSITFYLLAVFRLIETRYRKGALLRTLVLMMELVVSVIIQKRITFDAIYATLNFFGLFILLSTDNNIVMTKTMKRCTYGAMMLIVLFLFITYRSKSAYIFEDGRSTRALVLGMTNPNLTALLICCIIGYLLIHFPESRYKITQVVIILALLYLIWLTDARSSILAIAIMVVYSTFFKRIKVGNLIVVGSVLVSILFVPFYLGLYTFLINTSGGYSFLGKTLFSGRQFIYQKCLAMLDSPMHVLFGNFGKMQFENAHNAPLAILCTIGVVGFLICYFVYTKQLLEINKRSETPTSRLALVMVLCLYILSSAEALMFTGIFPSTYFMLLFLVMADECKPRAERDS